MPIVLPQLFGIPPSHISLSSRNSALAAPLNSPRISPQIPRPTDPAPLGLSSLLQRDIRIMEFLPDPWRTPKNRLLHPLQSGLWLAGSLRYRHISYRHISKPLFLEHQAVVLSQSSVFPPSPTHHPTRQGDCPGAAPRLTSQYRGPSCRRPPDPTELAPAQPSRLPSPEEHPGRDKREVPRK